MDALKDAFSFTAGPRSLLSEVIGFVVFSLVLLGLTFSNGGGDYSVATIVMGSYAVMTAGRYVWWHYRPYKAPPPPPVTRYTNPRYTKH
ncbi:MAG: hypothetical protein ABI903_12725 [Actinomycetota bacterium]